METAGAREVKKMCAHVDGFDSERQIELTLEGLERLDQPIPFELDAGLRALIEELTEWLDDDRQWASGHSEQWKSLLADVLGARSAAGPHLRRHLAGVVSSWDELTALKGQVGGRGRGAPEPSLRQRLSRATRAIGDCVLEAEALEVAFDDLLESNDHLDAREAARRLVRLVEAQGLPSAEVVKDLTSILEDNLWFVKTARGERHERDDIRRRAGLAPAQRIELARSALGGRDHIEDAVIWLEYTLAPLPSGHLALGDAVELFTTDWLLEAIAEERHEELPLELRAPQESHSNLRNLLRLNPDPDEDAEKQPEDWWKSPVAFFRVELGLVEISQALQLGREAAELIVALSVLSGSHPELWQPTGSFVRVLGGREADASFYAPPLRSVSMAQHDAMKSDVMPELAVGLGQNLAGHLPVRDVRLRRAARLALWLRRTRETWEPGRVVLAGRVLEQIAGWAGVGDRVLFESEYLKLAWALRRIRLEISNAFRGIWAAHHDRDPLLNDGGWEKVLADPSIAYEERPDTSYTISLRGVIEKADFLAGLLDSGSPAGERLTMLADRTASGKATADWIVELEREFDVLKSRERRSRNALVHGGAVEDEVAASVLLFVDWLAADALHSAIEGILEGTELLDYFIDFRARREQCRSSLEAGEKPSSALFWEE
jgi:hypothetical protein